MAADAPKATKVIDPALRHRAGQTYPNPLAPTPGKPEFAASVVTADGKEIPAADPTITRVALACMNTNAVHGGAACHWGGPSAQAEISSAVHALVFQSSDWRKDYNLANDAGHAENGIYALKANYRFAGVDWQGLKHFRSVKSSLTGHGESHLFPEGVMVSNGPLGSTLPITQGLAMADRLANLNRTTICLTTDGGMMEGEAREALAAIPGLAARGLMAPFVMVLSDNNTKLSGRIDDDSFSMLPSFEALASLGWTVVRVADGHDLQKVFSAVESAVKRAKLDPTRPIAVWVKTIKGYGVKATEASASGGHGFPLKNGSQLRAFVTEFWTRAGRKIEDLPAVFNAWIAELEAEQAAKDAKAKAAPAAAKAPSDKIQAGFPKAMIAAAKAGAPVVCVSADLQGSTGVAPFHAEFPQFSFDVGIMESDMVSAAVGFSKQGYIPVVDTFAQFGVTKGLLPLCMGSLSQSPVLAAFTHIGFQDAADGASHQSLMYLSMTSGVPGVVPYLPATAEEAEWAMGYAIKQFQVERAKGHHPDSVLFFCGRENFPISIKPQGANYEWGKAMVVADTTAGMQKSVTISASGSMVSLAMKAAESLKADGIGAIVLNNAMPSRPDLAAHTAALAKTGGRLISVEEHQKIGGAGAMLLAALTEKGIAVKPSILAVNGEFGRSAYSAMELYDLHGIGVKGIVAAAKG